MRKWHGYRRLPARLQEREINNRCLTYNATKKSYEYAIDMHILFTDFKQAADKLRRTNLIQELEEIEAPKNLIKFIRMSVENSTALINIEQKQQIQ